MAINNNDIAVLRGIAKRRRNHPVTQLQIAIEVGLTDRTVRSSIKRLHSANLITICGGKQGKAYSFDLLPAALEYVDS